jgi:hypothetical protein
MVGCGAFALRYDQRASFGTQKILAALYSSGSSGSAPFLRCVSSSACLDSKASDNVLQEDQAEDDVLVLCRIHIVAETSAICHSLASKPRLAPVSGLESAFPLFAIDGLAPSSAALSSDHYLLRNSE